MFYINFLLKFFIILVHVIPWSYGDFLFHPPQAVSWNNLFNNPFSNEFYRQHSFPTNNNQAGAYLNSPPQNLFPFYSDQRTFTPRDVSFNPFAFNAPQPRQQNPSNEHHAVPIDKSRQSTQNGLVNTLVLPHTPDDLPKSPKCNGTDTKTSTSKGNLKINLPFMDVEIQTDRNLHVAQEPLKQELFVLHGNELFRLLVNRHEKHLVLIGHLQGNVQTTEPIDFQIISLYNYYVVVVALEEHLEIYQISADVIDQRLKNVKNVEKPTDDNIPQFILLQQLILFGRFHKMFLIDAENEKVMLIVTENYTKLYGKFRTFEWLHTYFESIDELTVPQLTTPQIVGTYPKYLISGKSIKHQSRTVLSVYEVKTPTLHLKPIQTLTIDSRNFWTTSLRGVNLIIACHKNQKKCSIFHMKNAHFKLYRRRSWQELYFGQFSSHGHNFLVGSQQNEVRVFTNSRLDCYSSFTTNETMPHNVLLHMNSNNEHFILLEYKRPFYSLLRLIEVNVMQANETNDDLLGTTIDMEEMPKLNKQQHLFEETILELRNMLLKRRMTMDVFRQAAAKLKPKIRNIDAKQPVRVANGKIGIVQIVDETVRCPGDILKRVEELRTKYGGLLRKKRSMHPPIILTLERPHLQVHKMKVKNLIYEGDLLEGFHLNKSSKPLPILSVKHKLYAHRLKTSELLTRNVHRVPRHDVMNTTNRTINGTIELKSLKVKRINNINWDEFHDLLFLRNRDTIIEGRLILQNQTKVVNLWTQKLNNLIVDELFNLKTPQVINTDMLISRFYVNDLQAERINNLRFDKDIVVNGRDDVIETPVKINQFSISGDLILNDQTKKQRDTTIQEPSLKQYYTGQVIINGSLTVKNLIRDTNSTRIIIDGKPLTQTYIKDNYMLKREAQKFNKSVTFGNAKVFTPSLRTTYLNGQPTEQHLLTVQRNSKMKPLNVVFMTAHIDGDLKCMNHTSKLKELDRNVVRHGDVVNITGIKYFKAPLSVDHLMTLQLNDQPVDDFVLKSQLAQSIHFTDTKTFENIIVTNRTLINRELNTTYLNNLPLDDLLNYNYYLDYLKVPHKLEAHNIIFDKLNGIPFDSVLTKLKLHNDEDVKLHKDLIIDGNVEFFENLQVKYINHIEWESYRESLVRSNENATIYGEKHFLRDLTITNALHTPTINHKNLDDIFEKILTKSTAQIISGDYAFDYLSLTNADVSVINDVPTSTFINLEDDHIEIHSDLIIPKLTIKGAFNVPIVNELNLTAVEERLKQLPQLNWQNLYVHGDVEWNNTIEFSDTKQYNRLQYLHKNAVRKSTDQVISGNVHMKTPLIKNMYTAPEIAFPNSVNFSYLANDCLLKNTNRTQIVYGRKIFNQQLNVRDMEVITNLETKFLNGIDILQLNVSLYRVSSGQPIYGPLKFITPPHIRHLTVEGLINGINTTDIYLITQGPMPPVRIHNLIVDTTLEIGEINDMSLLYLLNNRVRKHGEAMEVFGHLTFEHLHLNEEILLRSINGIPIDNFVFKKSDQIQAITGTKTIIGNLILDGPTHVLNLNGFDLITNYQQTMFTDGNYHLDRLIVDDATFEQGILWANGIDATANERSIDYNSDDENAEEVKDEPLHALDEFLKSANASNRNDEFMYLDYAYDVNIVWHKANETVVKLYTFEMKRVSMCNREILQVELSKDQRLFISNYTTNLLTKSSSNLNVKVENYCTIKHRKVRSKISIANRNLLKIFGMNKHIINVEIFAARRQPTDQFVVLHGIDFSTQRQPHQHNEIRILKVNNTNEVHDWQAITANVGHIMRLFAYKHLTILVCNAAINNRSSIMIYQFMEQTQKFELLQSIDGNYDLIELVQLPSKVYHLILSCHKCRHLHIYEYQHIEKQVNGPAFKMHQILKLQIAIEKLIAFKMSANNYYLMLMPVANNDYYYLYKYAYVQGWRQNTYGYFAHIKFAVPLITNNGINNELDKEQNSLLMLLLCGIEKQHCNVVKAVIQDSNWKELPSSTI